MTHGGDVDRGCTRPSETAAPDRSGAAQKVFADCELEVLGDQCTGGDAAKTEDIVTQCLQRGDVDGIWMDAGDAAVAAVEAFEKAGKDYPVMVGEEAMSFLRKWRNTDITAIAPVDSNFQWRTPVEAAVRIWNGQPVPRERVLPREPAPSTDETDASLEANAEMASLQHAEFGGEDLTGYPEAWTDR